MYEDALALMDGVTGQQQWQTPTAGGSNLFHMPMIFSKHLCGYVYPVATGNKSGEFRLILLDRHSGQETHRITCWKYKGRPELAKKCIWDAEMSLIDDFLILFPGSLGKSNACVISGGPSFCCFKFSRSEPNSVELLAHFYVYLEAYLGHVFASQHPLLGSSNDFLGQSIVSGLKRKVKEDGSHLVVQNCFHNETSHSGIILCVINYHLFIAGEYSTDHSLALTVDLEMAHSLEEPCRTFAAINIPRYYKHLVFNQRNRIIRPTILRGEQNQEEHVVLEILKSYPYTARMHSFSSSLEILDFEEEEANIGHGSERDC